jgi:hypothetical protein
MKQTNHPIRNAGFSLQDALQYNRDRIKQQLKNRHSGYHACTVLKMLQAKKIISAIEIADLRQVETSRLAEKIIPVTSNLRPSTQKVYANTAQHAIQEFLNWKTAN